MLEIAGFYATAVGVLIQLSDKFSDWSSWDKGELEVDRNWLSAALSAGVLEGPEDDFRWMRANKVPTAELEGNCSRVVVYNENDRSMRFVRRADLTLVRITRVGFLP